MKIKPLIKRYLAKIGGDLKVVNAKIGSLSTLQTIFKSNVVGAINEVQAHIPIIGSGRPDIPSTLSDDNQPKVTNAVVGTVFTSTDGAGVGAWQWQLTSDGWRLNDGDTGWIDLTKQSNPKSPYYQIKRAGDTIHLLLDQWGGYRIPLPYGFTAGASFFQFVAPLPDGTTANIELSSTGDVYLMGSNQGKPFGQNVTDNFKTKSTFNGTWEIIKRNELGLKAYITFASPDPFPTELPVPLDETTWKRGNTYVSVSDMTCSGSGFVLWDNSANYTSVDNTGDIISGDDVVCNVPFPRSTLGTTIEIRAGADSSATNGASIWYSTDGTTWVDSGVVTAGHTDNEAMRDAKYYDIPVAGITNISLRKAGFRMNSYLISCKEYATP